MEDQEQPTRSAESHSSLSATFSRHSCHHHLDLIRILTFFWIPQITIQINLLTGYDITKFTTVKGWDSTNSSILLRTGQGSGSISTRDYQNTEKISHANVVLANTVHVNYIMCASKQRLKSSLVCMLRWRLHNIVVEMSLFNKKVFLLELWIHDQNEWELTEREPPFTTFF